MRSKQELWRLIDNSLFSPDCWDKSQILFREGMRFELEELLYDVSRTSQGFKEQCLVGQCT